MKKFLFFISVATFTQTKAQLTSSLTACYALDGNANDPISVLNGTLGAVTSVADRNNNAGSAYSFTGSAASKITLPNDTKIKGNEMSFSAWVKPVNTNASQYIVFTKNQATSNFEGYALAYDGISKFIVAKGNNGSVANVFGTTTVSANSWHHVAFTFDNANVKLYVDGVLDGTTASTLSAGYDAAKNVILGGSAESFNLPYNGLMDNVRFYNRVITASEVSQLYSQDPSCTTTTVTVDLTSSLTACYALNGNATDPISSLNGTVGAVNTAFDRFSNTASAYSFTGSATSIITLPNDSKIKGNEMTVSAWVKPVNTNSSQYIVFAKNQASSNFEAYSMGYDGVSKFYAIKGNNGSVATVYCTNTISVSNWHHVAFTFDNASLKLYVDGVLEGTYASTLTAGYDAAKNVILGGSGESFNLPYNGLLDNVRFYNRALNGSEVAQLYSQDPTCVTTVTTGIATMTNETHSLNVYPNPAQSLLTVDFGKETSGRLLVKDVLGHVLNNLEVNNQNFMELDLSSQANGIYFVELISKDRKQIQKVIKN